MPTIETIQVDVVSDVTKFVSGFTKAGKQTAWFKDRAKAAGKTVDKFTAAISKSAVFGLRRFDKQMKNVTKSTDRAAKSTKRLAMVSGRLKVAFAAITSGVAVRGFVRMANAIDDASRKAELFNLTINSLRGIQFAGASAGVSVETLNMALQRMGRRIGEVSATGRGEAKDTLSRLGLDPKVLAKMTADQQLLQIADGLKRITNQSEKLAALQKIFDSEGVAMGRFLDGGSEKVRAFIAEAEKIGGVISDADVKRVRSFTAVWEKLKFQTVGTLQRIVITFAPEAEQRMRELIWLQQQLPTPKSLSGIMDRLFSPRTGQEGERGPAAQFFSEQRGIYDFVLNKLAKTSAPAALPHEIQQRQAMAGRDVVKDTGLKLDFGTIKSGIQNLTSRIPGAFGAVGRAGDRANTFATSILSRFAGGFAENERIGREARKRNEQNRAANRGVGITRGDTAEGFAALRAGGRQQMAKQALEISKKQLGTQKDLYTLWKEALARGSADAISIEGA